MLSPTPVQPAPLVKLIEWSEPRASCTSVPYNHVVGSSPIGNFTITWKGWKDYPSYDLDEHPFNDYLGLDSATSLEEAKATAQAKFEQHIKACLNL